MKTNRAINGIIREILWLGEIFHREGLFGGSQSKPSPSRAEQSRALLTLLPQIPRDQSSNPSSSSFHLGQSSQPDTSFQCEEMQQMESHGKARRQKRNICVSLLMAPVPEFSWKFYLMLKHDPSLKLISIFSISAFVSCWCCWVLGEYLELQARSEGTFPTRCWQTREWC